MGKGGGCGLSVVVVASVGINIRCGSDGNQDCQWMEVVYGQG